MSADNYLGIYKVNSRRYIARSCPSECQTDCKHCDFRVVFTVSSLKQVWDKAKEAMSQDIYEYGINFIN